MLYYYYVCSGVGRCVNDEGYFSPNLECYWDILLSQQILDATKRVTDGNLIFQQYSALTLIAFSTVRLLQCKIPIFLSFWATAPKWSGA